MDPVREEEAFLAKLRADPSDDEARLVYADWLSERDTAQSADQVAFLRAQVEGALAELGELVLDPGWLAKVDKAPIEICGHTPLMRHHCPGRWEELLPRSRDGRVRFCAECGQNVWHCATLEEAATLEEQQRCMAASSLLRAKEGPTGPRSA